MKWFKQTGKVQMCINIENTIFKIFSTKTDKDVFNTHLPRKFYLKEFRHF